jgi:tetratricopeptide (TPR) repeat protein
LARLLLANGRLAEAQQALRTSRPDRYKSPFQYYAREPDRRLALAQGDYKRAIRLADEEIEMARPQGVRTDLVQALALKGQALAASGRGAEAQTVYQEARAVAEEIGSRRALWPILAALARLAATQGDHAQANQLRRRARDVLEYILDHLGDAGLRASLLSLPDAHEVMGTAQFSG